MGIIGKGMEIAFAKAEGARNREFTERMSSSAYQRATVDMRAAGINPILMASSMGAGASTPAGGGMSPGGGGGDIGDDINSAMAIKQSYQDIKKKKEDLNFTTQQITQSKSQTANQNSMTVVNRESYNLKQAQRHLVEAQVQDQLNRNVGSALEAQINSSRFMRGMRYGERGLPFLNTLVGAYTAKSIAKGRGLPAGGGVLLPPRRGGGPSSARGAYEDDPRGNRVRRGPGKFKDSDIPY